MDEIERHNEGGTADESAVKKVAIVSSIGATVEWYDFFLFGTAAGLVSIISSFQAAMQP